MSLFNKKIGRTINSETLIATAADSRNDVISTVAVLTANAIIAYFTGFAMLDGIMGCLVALFIIFSGIGLVRDTLIRYWELPDADEVKEIEEKVMSYPSSGTSRHDDP